MDSIWIGIDYGTKKCGIARSSPCHTYALPLGTVPLCPPQQFLNLLQRWIEGREVLGWVVGRPLSMDGSTNHGTEKVDLFCQALQAHVAPQRVLQWDERLTTRLAQRNLRECAMKRKKRDALDDAVAASLILESFLAAQPN